MINLTTGPVQLKKEVVDVLTKKSISHRSIDYKRLHEKIVKLMCEKMNVNNVAIMQGSGTLANEAMIWQIKALGMRGIILSNGEFGDRLIDQSKRIQLDFIEYKVAWGDELKPNQIEALIEKNKASWLLFTHCETSTGIINRLENFAEIAQKRKVKIYLDCMSTIGTQKIDLSSVTMASCSSGKGLASIAGISMVLTNDTFARKVQIPKYFDLSLYDEKKTPFTISSNLLEALYTSSKVKLREEIWAQKDQLSTKVFQAFHSLEIIPFSKKDSRVFTFVPKQFNSVKFCQDLKENGIELSCNSDYLLSRNWFQLALFGNHNLAQVEEAIQLIAKRLNAMS